MKNRRKLLKSATAVIALSLAGPVAAQSTEQIPVVATFSILGDMVERIGGEHAALTTHSSISTSSMGLPSWRLRGLAPSPSPRRKMSPA